MTNPRLYVPLSETEKRKFDSHKRMSKAMSLLDKKLKAFKENLKESYGEQAKGREAITFTDATGKYELANLSEGKGKPGFDLEGLSAKYPEVFAEFFISATPVLNFRFA